MLLEPAAVEQDLSLSLLFQQVLAPLRFGARASAGVFWQAWLVGRFGGGHSDVDSRARRARDGAGRATLAARPKPAAEQQAQSPEATQNAVPKPALATTPKFASCAAHANDDSPTCALRARGPSARFNTGPTSSA